MAPIFFACIGLFIFLLASSSAQILGQDAARRAITSLNIQHPKAYVPTLSAPPSALSLYARGALLRCLR